MADAAARAEQTIEAVGSDGSFSLPLSHEQARLWFLSQANPSDTRYHMAYRLRLSGRLDAAALSRAIDRVVARHDILRTRYVGSNGEPRQLVIPTRRQRLDLIDLSRLSIEERRVELARLEDDIVRHPFDLSSGELMRMRLIRLSETEHSLAAVMHHIIGDGWSHAVLTRDICAFYRAEMTGRPEDLPPPLSIQYVDYAFWQRQFTKTPACTEHVRYWIDELRRVSGPLALPRDFAAATGNGEGDTLRFGLPTDLRARLLRTVAAERRLISAVLLALYQATLARFADQDSFPVGLATANRAHAETADLIGFFVNTLALPSDLEGAPAFAQLANRVQQRLIHAQDHQSAPFELVAAGLGASGRWGETPLISALLVVQNAPAPRFDLPGLRASVERIPTGTSKFELTLFAVESERSLDFEIEYDRNLFARSTVESFRDTFVDLFEACLADPDTPMRLLPPGRRSRPSICAGPRRPETASRTIPALVAEQARRSPHAVAVTWPNGQLTYGDLLAVVRAHAAELETHGVARGDVVGVLLPRSAELVVSLLGILTAGAAYAPMSPDLPDAYVDRLIESRQIKRLVTQRADLDSLPLPSLDPTAVRGSDSIGEIAPADLAYLLHTSGSTGVPKGVLIEHGGLANVCLWIAGVLQLGARDRCLLKTPVSFDAAARELYPILLAGGTLVISDADAHRDAAVLHANLSSSRATILHCVPAQLEALIAFGPLPPAIRAVMCGGDRLRAATARRFTSRARARLWNVYGPTEATVDALAFEVLGEIDSPAVPIGRPIPNMTAVVVDPGGSGQPVPVGAIGEIHLTGVGVARGCLHPSAGYEAFAIDRAAGQRRYATGDRGRVGADGSIEFLGRGDRQLKRRGVRIEPASIERAALEHPAVGAAAVVAADAAEVPRLVAFVAPGARVPPRLPDADACGAIISAWQSVFETSYETLAFDENGRSNTHGWFDSVHRAPIPSHEILAGADEAAARILRWKPATILEIGCGTGLLLFRLAPRCARYHAVDFAQRAVDYVQHQARLADLRHVRVERASAHDFVAPACALYDAIVLNSVVQYLPDPDSLAALMNRLAAHLAPGGFLFVGDVRDRRLNEAASLARAVTRLDRRVRAASALFMATLDRERDGELCLDPAFFARWASGVQDGPGFAGPLIEAKASAGDNELVRYRFDVTLARRSADKEDRASRVTVQVAGTYVNRLLVDDLAQVRRATHLPPSASIADLVAASSLARGDNHRCLSPAEALEHSGGRTGVDGDWRTICRIRREPDLFDVVHVSADAAVADVAAAAGYASEERSQATAPGRFLDFLDQTHDIGDFLRTRLPLHEMPDAVIRLPFLPLTPHGKTDLEVLQAIGTDEDARAAEVRPAVTPACPVEAAICDVFSSVVGARFDPQDDFFLRGGHSLLATQARARLSQRLDVEIPLRLMFEHSTARGLAAQIDAIRDGAASAGSLAIHPRPNRATATPSFAQTRLWFIEKLGTAQTIYNISHALRVEGPFDLDAFDRAVGDLLARHVPLRSRFPEIDGRAGVVVDPPSARGNVECLDGGPERTLQEAIEECAARAKIPFDLERDRLIRVLVTPLSSRNGPAVHLLCIVVHHIVADGWSMALAVQELAALYNARVTGVPSHLAPLDVDYYDLAAWQISAAARGAFDGDLSYWLHELDGAPARLDLASDHPVPQRRSWRGDSIVLDIGEELTRGVKALSHRAHATDFMTLFAAYAVLLHRMSGMRDLVVGTVIANRHRLEAEPLVGFLVNPVAIRTAVNPRETFADILERVKAKALGAFEHQDAPFEMILERLDVDRRADYQAVFQVLFAMQNTGGAEPTLSGVSCERVRLDHPGAMFDLSLEIKETVASMRGVLEYSTDLFRPETARLVADRYVRLVAYVTRHPDVPIDDIPIASGEERARVLRFSRGPASKRHADETMPHRLQALAMDAPGRVALEEGALVLTYADFAARVAAQAHRLRAAGVARGDFVGVHLPRGASAAVASFGAQFLGAASVYVDPQLPLQRRRDILAEAGIRTCVGAIRVPDIDGIGWVAPEDLGAPSDPTLVRAVPATRPGDVAFATFTSGSSGSPKAVMVEQHAIARRLRANDEVLGPLGPLDRVAHAYSFNYDGGLVTLFWPACSGATTVFLPLDLLGDRERLAAALQRHRITVLDTIPAVLRDLFSQPLMAGGAPLRMVVTGGDVCPQDVPEKVLQSAAVVFANQYGPCEAVVNATTWTADRTRLYGRKVTIGRPIPDADVFIVDERDQLCPIGTAGEILIGGPALARGYLNAPDLTREKFPILDLTGDGAERVYRTGDKGRWLVDGEIEFLGRIDRQIQIRGMRSDPAEVETAIRSCAGVSDCYVAADGAGDQLAFVAYVVAALEAAPSEPASPTSEERERVAEWRNAFDALFHAERPHIRASDADYTGWNDTGTGEPIPVDDMHSWRTATIERIRTRSGPRILEIGAGLGILALPLAAAAESYIATDVSPIAAEQLADSGRRAGLDHLKVMCLDAADIDGLAGEAFDLIVLNSVIQYFPSAAFLRRTLGACARLLAPGGSLFVGDVRDVRLARLCHIEVAASRCHLAATPDRIRRLAAERERLDDELQVAPAWFGSVPDGCRGVLAAQPLLKVYAGCSEMARYRYDVWLQRTGPESPAVEGEVMTWANRSSFIEELREHLRTTASPHVTVCDIPNRRLSNALAIDAVAARRKETATRVDIDPNDVVELAQSVNRRVVVSPGGPDGTTFDAVFVPPSAERAITVRPVEHGIGQRLFNQPLLGRRIPHLRAGISASLAERLPDHMRPRRYVFVESIPMKPGGKIDVLALPEAADGQLESPANVECGDLPVAVMGDVWRSVIGCTELPPDADFFALGGHSLLAARLAGTIRREFRVEFPVIRIFELRTLSAMTREVSLLRGRAGATGDANVPPAINWFRNWSPGDPPFSRNQRHILARLRDIPQDGRFRHVGIAMELAPDVETRLLDEALAVLAFLHPLLGRRFAADGQVVAAGVAPQLKVLSGSADVATHEAREPLSLERDGPLSLARVVGAAGASILVARVHPACFDSESLSIALNDLAGAYRTLTERSDPRSGHSATDYGALAVWEQSEGARYAAHRFASSWPRLEAPARRDRVRRYPDSSGDPAVAKKWSPEDTSVLDRVAARLGATPCAVLLGAFAMEAARLSDAVVIECSISTRAALAARAIVGPFAVDLPLRFPAGALRDLPDAAAAAATAIAALFDELPFSLDGSQYPWADGFAFSYLDRPDDLRVSWGKSVGRTVLHASPLWSALKLSAYRQGQSLELKLRRDPERYPAHVAEAILPRMRHCVLDWGAR